MDYFEINSGALKEGKRCLIFDDLLATGGSARAAMDLIEKCGCKPVGAVFIVELVDLNGSRQLNGVPVKSIFKY